jgi:nonsense-mediated mRNA decay protein 3
MFKAVCGRDRLTEFKVINIEDVDFDVSTSKAAARNKFNMVRVEICRAADYGEFDKTFSVLTHLGNFITYNDTVLGYDLNQMTMQELEDYELDKTRKKMLPDIVIVRKIYPKIRKAQKARIWKLKHLNKEELNENDIHARKKGKKKDKDTEVAAAL